MVTVRVLITGHTGFIGSNLVHYLTDAGIETVGFSRGAGGNIADFNQLRRATEYCDLVIHAAGSVDPSGSIDHPEETLKVNILGTHNVLLVCREARLPCIYISSCEVYGDSTSPITELTPLSPPNPYAFSKAAADLLCHTYYRCYGVDVRSVRLFNPYGPAQQLVRIIPAFYRQAKMGGPLTVYGDGSDTRDYVYIDDVVSGIWMARQVPAGMGVNLATGKATSTLEVARLILRLSASHSSIVFKPYPEDHGGIFRQLGSAQTMKRLTNWRARIPLEEGVHRTLAWLDTLWVGGS
jgi:dTDP-glucose 4,6-dehydratase